MTDMQSQIEEILREKGVGIYVARRKKKWFKKLFDESISLSSPSDNDIRFLSSIFDDILRNASIYETVQLCFNIGRLYERNCDLSEL